MNRKVLALIAAVVFAAVGTFAIVAYVQGAEDRALAGEVVTNVLVVDQQIPAGTRAEDITKMVRTEQVVAKVRAEGAVTDLADLSGKVASVSLLPGEQIVSKRFTSPSAFHARGASVDIPSGMLQTSIILSPDRTVGGIITPGSTVAITMSYTVSGGEPAEGEAAVPGEGADAFTHMTLRRVLVTNIQTDDVAEPTENKDTDQSGIEPGDAPSASMLITVALNDIDSERLIYAAEHGTIWLSLESSSDKTGATKVVTIENVYE